MPVYDEAAYKNALIDLFTDTLGYTHVYGPDIDRAGILRFMILFLKILSGVLIQMQHLLQLMRHFLNSDILKMLNLRRKTPFLWNTCRMVLK